MYGISPNVYERIQRYFEKEQNIKQVVLFGSRAKGTDTINSDIDLAIEIENGLRGKIVEDLEPIRFTIKSFVMSYSKCVAAAVSKPYDKIRINV